MQLFKDARMCTVLEVGPSGEDHSNAFLLESCHSDLGPNAIDLPQLFIFLKYARGRLHSRKVWQAWKHTIVLAMVCCGDLKKYKCAAGCASLCGETLSKSKVSKLKYVEV